MLNLATFVTVTRARNNTAETGDESVAIWAAVPLSRVAELFGNWALCAYLPIYDPGARCTKSRQSLSSLPIACACTVNRSHVHRLTVQFDEPVNVAGPGAMTLHNTNDESVMWGEFFFVEALSKVVTETK